MQRPPAATALRTRCAERTHAMQSMQFACMCAYAHVCAITCTFFSQNVCVRDDMVNKYERKQNLHCFLCRQLKDGGMEISM